MARLSMNELTTYRWSFEKDVHNYNLAGFDGIGVWRAKLNDCGEEKALESLRDSGLEVSNLLWAGGFTGSEGRPVKDCVADAKEAIRLAASLRAGCLIIYTGSRNGHTENHALRLVKDALKAILPCAEEFGVTLAIEPMHERCGCNGTFLNCLEETLRFIEMIRHPLVRIAFDTYHFGHRPEILQLLPRLAPLTSIVHLGDGDAPPCGEQSRCRLDEGTIPLTEIIATLIASGYDGYFDVELLGEEIESCNYVELLKHSRETFDQLIKAIEFAHD